MQRPDPNLITIVKPGDKPGPEMTPETVHAMFNPTVDVVEMRSKPCAPCCAGMGLILSTCMGLIMMGCVTAFAVAQSSLKVPFNIMMRQAMWMTFPGMVVCTTLHFFFAEAAWSQRRNSFGMAWAKAVVMNTTMWLGIIGGCTAIWRFGLKGTKIYRLYPIPMDRLEKRLMLQPDAFWTGMGTTYWLMGVFTGQMGFAATATSSVYSNKLHWMMSPTGMYAHQCLPPHMRRAIAQYASYVSSP
eukprot:PhM_4_TR10335/c0_g1_i2/m.75970